MDYLVDQFRAVLGEELVVRESTTHTTTQPSPPAPLVLDAAHGRQLCPRPPLEPVPTVASGPPPGMVPTRTPWRRDKTVLTGPPAHMTPPPELLFDGDQGPADEPPYPAALPPLARARPPHDAIPTVVLRRIPRQPTARRPELVVATQAHCLGVADTVRYLAPPETAEQIPLPHQGLAASRRRGTTMAGWEQPYLSLEITDVSVVAPRPPRAWPRLAAALGLAALILALSGCTAYLLAFLDW